MLPQETASIEENRMDKKLQIFCGAYGSGKTEVSINTAFKLQDITHDVAIIDLDLVNPYFRSRELKQSFQSKGIIVVAPAGELSGADLPIITPQVRGYLSSPKHQIVIDVGGDDAGSRALSQFAPVIKQLKHDLYMVINDRRPWTNTVQGIAESVARVEHASRLKVTALISNPNLGADTSIDVIHKGHKLVLEAGTFLGLPVAFLGVLEELAAQLDPDIVSGVPLLHLKRHLLPPWWEEPQNFAPHRDRRTVMAAIEKADRRG